MLYISRGILLKTGKSKILVSWRGKEVMLEGSEAKLWRLGCFDSSLASAGSLEALTNLGLVETAENDTSLCMYHLLTQCVICPAPIKLLRWPMRTTERHIWHWVSRAEIGRAHV